MSHAVEVVRVRDSLQQKSRRRAKSLKLNLALAPSLPLILVSSTRRDWAVLKKRCRLLKKLWKSILAIRISGAIFRKSAIR